MHRHRCFLCVGKGENHLKKTQIRYSEADENAREAFKETLAKIETRNPDKSTFCVDETGVDKFLYRENARAKRGTKVYRKIRGKKFERLSIVAGKSGDKIAFPMVYSGTANAALFEAWFERFCAEISGNRAVMDNVRIHRKDALFQIAKRHDVTLLFQPPYSPNLNKIEKFWAWLKQEIRTALKICDNLMEAICYCFQLK
jgi:transposase